MTEATFQNDRCRYAYKDNAGSKHHILVTPHALASHYTPFGEHNGSTHVNITQPLVAIEVDDKGGAVLVFEAADGSACRVMLGATSPEALCDAVEAARLQTVTPNNV